MGQEWLQLEEPRRCEKIFGEGGDKREDDNRHNKEKGKLTSRSSLAGRNINQVIVRPLV